ncbi:MAG: hypothetical protein ACK504_12340 [Bacteroidota bacterium]
MLHKLFTIPKSKIKPFVQYQCEKMQAPIVWLNKFEKLIDLNRELFTRKDQVIKFEKALMIIELMRDAIEHKQAISGNTFDIKKVKNKLKDYDTVEDKLFYLCEIETEYKQLRPTIFNIHSVPFDEQISLEIDKLNKQEVLKEKSNQKKGALPNTKINSTTPIQLNCNLNYFVDVFFQLSQEKQAITNSLKEISEFIACYVVDKDNNPISADSVYTMLKPSNFDKRPKGNSRFKLE